VVNAAQKTVVVMSKIITLKEKPRDIEEEYQQIKKKILEGADEVIEVDADLFTRIRIGIAEKDIPHNNLQVSKDTIEYVFNEDGNLIGWPKNLFSLSLHLTGKFLRAQINHLGSKEDAKE
jgi:hypothetical protein